MPTLETERLLIRPVTREDVPPLAAILAEPAVAEWWPRWDAERCQREWFDEPEDDLVALAITVAGTTAGFVQFYEETDPDYRYAGMDIFIGAAHQGRGYGRETLSAVIAHLFEARDHHRLIIDPGVGNSRAIAAYTALGFRPVGVMRQYERGPDGSWRDSLLMDMLRSEWAAAR